MLFFYAVELIGETRAQASDDQDIFEFGFNPPSFLPKAMNLWATEYHLPQVQHEEKGIPLRDLQRRELGVKLSHRNWCRAAMEGSVFVIKNGQGVTFNFAGTSRGHRVDCRAYFPHRLGRTKFRLARGEYGDGVRNYRLVPYRTIAVDRSQNPIPYGSLLFIPKAVGNPIILPNGETVLHDGYFFAADTGGAIKGKHIDVYIGTAEENPFKWVRSNSKGIFKAYLVKDSKIQNYLRSIHVFN